TANNSDASRTGLADCGNHSDTPNTVTANAGYAAADRDTAVIRNIPHIAPAAARRRDTARRRRESDVVLHQKTCRDARTRNERRTTTHARTTRATGLYRTGTCETDQLGRTPQQGSRTGNSPPTTGSAR